MTKMAFEFNDLQGFLIVVLFTLPLTPATNIDCNGKPFHCLNSTHFMICVDLGGGVTNTIDDFVIPCPPTTGCHGNNRFECEFLKVEDHQPLHVIGVTEVSDLSVSTILTDSVVTTTKVPSIMVEETTMSPLIEQFNETALPALEEILSPHQIEFRENMKVDEIKGDKVPTETTTILPIAFGSFRLGSYNISAARSGMNEIFIPFEITSSELTNRTNYNETNYLSVLDTSQSGLGTTTTKGSVDMVSKNAQEINRTTEKILSDTAFDSTTTISPPCLNLDHNVNLNKPPDKITNEYDFTKQQPESYASYADANPIAISTENILQTTIEHVESLYTTEIVPNIGVTQVGKKIVVHDRLVLQDENFTEPLATTTNVEGMSTSTLETKSPNIRQSVNGIDFSTPRENFQHEQNITILEVVEGSPTNADVVFRTYTIENTDLNKNTSGTNFTSIKLISINDENNTESSLKPLNTTANANKNVSNTDPTIVNIGGQLVGNCSSSNQAINKDQIIEFVSTNRNIEKDIIAISTPNRTDDLNTAGLIHLENENSINTFENVNYNSDDLIRRAVETINNIDNSSTHKFTSESQNNTEPALDPKKSKNIVDTNYNEVMPLDSEVKVEQRSISLENNIGNNNMNNVAKIITEAQNHTTEKSITDTDKYPPKFTTVATIENMNKYTTLSSDNKPRKTNESIDSSAYVTMELDSTNASGTPKSLLSSQNVSSDVTQHASYFPSTTDRLDASQFLTSEINLQNKELNDQRLSNIKSTVSTNEPEAQIVLDGNYILYNSASQPFISEEKHVTTITTTHPSINELKIESTTTIFPFVSTTQSIITTRDEVIASKVTTLKSRDIETKTTIVINSIPKVPSVSIPLYYNNQFIETPQSKILLSNNLPQTEKNTNIQNPPSGLLVVETKKIHSTSNVPETIKDTVLEKSATKESLLTTTKLPLTIVPNILPDNLISTVTENAKDTIYKGMTNKEKVKSMEFLHSDNEYRIPKSNLTTIKNGDVNMIGIASGKTSVIDQNRLIPITVSYETEKIGRVLITTETSYQGVKSDTITHTTVMPNTINAQIEITNPTGPNLDKTPAKMYPDVKVEPDFMAETINLTDYDQSSKGESIRGNIIFNETLFTNNLSNYSILPVKRTEYENVIDRAPYLNNISDSLIFEKNTSSGKENVNAEVKHDYVVLFPNNVDEFTNKKPTSRSNDFSTIYYTIATQLENTSPNILQANTYNKIVDRTDSTSSSVTRNSTFSNNYSKLTNPVNQGNKNYIFIPVNTGINQPYIEKEKVNNKIINVTSLPVPIISKSNNTGLFTLTQNMDNIQLNPMNNEQNLTVGTPNAIKNSNANDNKPILFDCLNQVRGKYADSQNCQKFYICVGTSRHPVQGMCPNNTVFSEINKQCTKNLSHCVRNNQFRCLCEGRFSDFFKENVYYICVKHNVHAFLRYKLRCQSGYHLNKANVRCEKNVELPPKPTSSMSENSKADDQNGSTIKSEENEKAEKNYIECKQEGKFPYEKDCRKYYVCYKNGKDVYRRKIKECSSDEVFDKEKKKCVSDSSAEC